MADRQEITGNSGNDYTESGLPYISKRYIEQFLGGFHSTMDSILTRWIEEMSGTSVLEYVTRVVKTFPEEYRERIAFTALVPFKVLEARMIELRKRMELEAVQLQESGNGLVSLTE